MVSLSPLHDRRNTGLVAPRQAQFLRTLAERIDQRDPHAFNNLGVLYHSRGMHSDAVDALLRAVALDPRMQTAVRNLEVAAAEPGACDGLLETLATRVATNPDDRTAVRERAHLLRLTGRYTEAAGTLDALIAEHPEDAPALLERGVLQQRTGDLPRAQRWFERAAAASEQDTASRLHLAEVLQQRSAHEQALTVLNAVLLLEADLADAHRLRGSVLRDLGQHEAGLEAARRGAELSIARHAAGACLSLERLPPSNGHSAAEGVAVASVHSNSEHPDAFEQRLAAADALAEQALYSEALQRYEALRRAVDKNSLPATWRRAALSEARVRCILGDGAEALGLLHELLRQRPRAYGDDAETLALLASAHAAMWQQNGAEPRLARNAIARFLKVEPSSAALLHFVGNIAVVLREDALAMVLFRRALALDPMRPTPRVAIARLLSVKNDVLAAQLELVAALAVAPDLREAVLELARLHCATGRAADSLPLLVAQLNRAPNDADALALLAFSLCEVGRPDDALHALAHALLQNPRHKEALAVQARMRAAASHHPGASGDGGRTA